MARPIHSDMMRYRERIIGGSIIKTTLWLAWPIILGNLINISYNLVDTFWLGKLGKASLAAPTVSWPLIMLFYSIGMGFSFAGITLVSQYVGAGEYRLASKSAGHLLGFMLFISLILSGAGFTLSPIILRAMGVPQDVLPLAINYISIIFAGIPIAFLGFGFNAILSGIGDTRTPTILGAISSGINVVLDPLFIFGWYGFPELGVVGAAVATVISRAVLSLIGVILLARGYRGLKLYPRDLVFESWWLRKVVKIGIPISIQQSANSLGFVVMMGLVSRLGTAVIATYGIGIRIIDIIQAFTWGIMRATTVMIGQNIGAEKYDRAEKIAYENMKLIFTILGLGAILIFLFRAQLFQVFINDPQVIEEGSRFLAIFLPSIPFFGVFFVVGAVARGSGHNLAFTIISIIRLWVLRIGLTYVFSILMGMGSTGVWIAMTISNIGAGILAFAWVRMGTWKKRVIELPRETRITTPLEISGEPADDGVQK